MKVPYLDLVGQHKDLQDELVAAVSRVLAHGYFVSGTEVVKLETALAKRLNVPEVVSCNSGTDAIVLALKLHGVGPGDEVVTTAHSFIATANAISAVGAKPVFADIDQSTMVLDIEAAKRACTPKTRAIIPVHLNGYPCQLQALQTFAADQNIHIIEDCAQAFGSTRNGQSVGSQNVGCFSLHPLKILSACGDGGFLTLPDSNAANALRAMRNHGLVDRDHIECIGINSRLDTLQAAIVLEKLKVVDQWIEARRTHAEAYRDALSNVVDLPPVSTEVVQTYSAFVVRHKKRDALMAALHRRGVDAKVHYPLAIHQQSPYQDATSLPVTERAVGEILSLPISERLSGDQVRYAIAQIVEAVQELC